MAFLGSTALRELLTLLKGRLDDKAATSHLHAPATTAAAGFMSAEDKIKLSGVETGANLYSLPTATGSVPGGVKLSDSTGSTSGASAGVAATPAAVKAANDRAVTNASAITAQGTKVSKNTTDIAAVKAALGKISSLAFTMTDQAVWLPKGTFVIVADYIVNYTAAPTVMLYDFTAGAAVGYARTINAQRGELVQILSITTAHQVGFRVSGGAVSSVGGSLIAVQVGMI